MNYVTVLVEGAYRPMEEGEARQRGLYPPQETERNRLILLEAHVENLIERMYELEEHLGLTDICIHCTDGQTSSGGLCGPCNGTGHSLTPTWGTKPAPGARRMDESTVKYRKKPVEVEAVQHVAENSAAYEWAASIWPRFDHEQRVWPDHGVTIDPSTGEFKIKTLEGLMTVELNDWVIKGVQGELYPCKPDIFAATYEVAE